MSKRNKIILIVVLLIVFAAVIAVSAIFIPKIEKNETYEKTAEEVLPSDNAVFQIPE